MISKAPIRVPGVRATTESIFPDERTSRDARRNAAATLTRNAREPAFLLARADACDREH
jgi:hypothetical protein